MHKSQDTETVRVGRGGGEQRMPVPMLWGWVDDTPTLSIREGVRYDIQTNKLRLL